VLPEEKCGFGDGVQGLRSRASSSGSGLGISPRRVPGRIRGSYIWLKELLPNLLEHLFGMLSPRDDIGDSFLFPSHGWPWGPDAEPPTIYAQLGRDHQGPG